MKKMILSLSLLTSTMVVCTPEVLEVDVTADATICSVEVSATHDHMRKLSEEELAKLSPEDLAAYQAKYAVKKEHVHVAVVTAGAEEESTVCRESEKTKECAVATEVEEEAQKAETEMVQS